MTVSVQLIIIETIIPVLESGPYSLKISSTKLTAADEEKILTIKTGMISAGIRRTFPNGVMRSEKLSKAPEARNIPIETRSAIIVGAISMTI